MKTKLLHYSLLFTAVFSFFPEAHAQKNRYHLEPFGGIAFFRDGGVTASNAPLGDVDFEIEDGFSVGLRGGYNFDVLRIEGEFSYIEGDIDALEAVPNDISVRSDMKTFALVLNLLKDFKFDAITLTVGAGAGAAHVEFGEMSAGGFVAVPDSEEIVFIYQGLVRASYQFSGTASAGIGYRHVRVQEVEDRGRWGDPMIATGRSDYEFDEVGINLVELFVRFEF